MFDTINELCGSAVLTNNGEINVLQEIVNVN